LRLPSTTLRVAALVAAASLLFFGPAVNSQEPGSAIDVIAQTRLAVFGPSAEPGKQLLELSGPASGFGMEFEGTLVFDQLGRYRTGFVGKFTQMQGHDGEETWERDPSGDARRLQAGNAKFQHLFNWFLTSDWLVERDGLTLTQGKVKKSAAFATVQLDAGHGATATVTIDCSTWLPTQIEAEQFGRKMLIKITWLEKLGERMMPGSIKMTDGGKPKISWEMTESRVLDSTPSFSQPKDSLRVIFDRDISPKLEAKKASGGHIWVRPLINGKDMGWFLFDTGANGTVLDSKIAKKLEMPVVGAVDSTGIGGRSPAKMRFAKSMQLAGVRIEDVPVVSRDLSRLERSFGSKVAGILGMDLLSQGIIVYDESKLRVEFHVPDTFKLPRGKWEAMPIHNAKPAVRLEYEGHVGLFVIDTGAPGRLIFGPQATERHRMLEGRKTKRASASGTGGSVKARTGLIEYVKWGGQRFEEVPAMFLTENEGAGADVLRDGIVGANLIRRFVMVFDIEGERIAYMPRE
jgi:predicted aspartyl protease